MLGNGKLAIFNTEIVVVTQVLRACGDTSGLSAPHSSIHRKGCCPESKTAIKSVDFQILT